jgi:hypothetical protein
MRNYETHIGIITRVGEQADAETLRGAVYFKSITLSGDQEYPKPALPNFPLAGGKGEGFFWVPQVGDMIEVEINSSTINQNPRYTKMFYTTDGDIHQMFKDAYPFGKGFATRSGHILFFNDKKGEEQILIKSSKGSQVLLSDAKGKEAIYVIHGPSKSFAQFSTNGSISLVAVNKEKKSNVISLDTNTDAISIVSAKGSAVSLSDKISLVDYKGEVRVDLADGNCQVTSKKTIIMNSPSFTSKCGVHELGDQALFSAVCGENLVSYNDAHFHMTAAGPSSPPSVPMVTYTGTPLSITTPYVKVQKPL